MENFLFIFQIRNLPVYSTVLGVSNSTLLLICMAIQFLVSTLFFQFQKPISFIYLLLSALIFLFLLLKNPKFGYFLYFFQLTVTVFIWIYWVLFVIKGLDCTVHDFRQGEYKRMIKTMIVDYIFSGILIIFSILILFFLLIYSNELKFEEIKKLEDEKEETMWCIDSNIEDRKYNRSIYKSSI